MDGSQRRGSGIGTIALGVLALAASVLWTLFWLLAGIWEWPYFGDALSEWLFFGAMFAAGIVTFLVAVFLLIGHYPGRKGWLVVSAVALIPCAPLIVQGRDAQEHVAAATSAAERAYEKRSGLEGVSAQCIWEYDQDDSETWRCEMGRVGHDSCLVNIANRTAGRAFATIDRCERDEALVDGVVQRAYLKRSGLLDVATDCDRISESGESETWGCDLGTFPPANLCVVTIDWREGGRISARISRCESTDVVNRVVERAYAKRRGLGNVRAACYREWNGDKPESWECDMRRAAGDDHCAVKVMRRDAGRVTVGIRRCTNDVG